MHLLSTKNFLDENNNDMKIDITATDFGECNKLYKNLPSTDNEFLPHFEEANGWYLGAFDGSKLIGFLAGSVWSDAIAGTIAVLPEYRKMGVGTSLVEKHIKLAKDVGGKFIVWRCHHDNTASENLVKHFGGEYISEEDNWKRYKISL